MDVRVQQTINTMEEQLHQRLTVAALAGDVGLSVTHLTRLFRAAKGTTPGAFLHELRMARARVLVERTAMPIADVMRSVGISDRSHFARDFRRHYGLTPRTLRVELRESGPAR